MTSKCVHRIEIANLSDGETVNHVLLLIKGRIIREGVGTQASTRREAEEEKLIPDNIQLQLFSFNNQAEQFCFKAPVSHSSEFKLLVDLRHFKAGEHKLTLCLIYCNAEERRLNIVYSTSSTISEDFQLQPLWILCKGEKKVGTEVSDACEKIDLNLQLVQCIYADKLRAAGFGRRTFKLNNPCCPFYTELTCEEAWQREEDELWSHFAAELLNSPTWAQKDCGVNKNLKFVAFIACTKYDANAVATSGDYSYANIRRHLKAHAALGGGGLALFGSAYLYAWPRHFNEILNCFCDSSKVNPAQLPDDSNYRRTYGGVYASTLGAVCHELGHTFDLGHSHDGVMGSDFDYVNRVFTIDTRTEHLPARVIYKGVLEAQPPQQRSRLTQLKRSTGMAKNFLDKYHEQRKSDCFYFTRNCALILAHHKWLRGVGSQFEKVTSSETTDSIIVFDCINNSVNSSAEALLIIEVRCHANSLVDHFYEFDRDVEVFSFQLPAEALNCCLQQQSHYLFIMTKNGLTKRFFERGLI